MKDRIIQANKFTRPVIENLQTVEITVAKILKDIETNGDSAVNRWNKKIDGQHATFIKLLPFDEYNLEPEVANAIKSAYDRIKKFCEFQMKNLQNDNFSDNFGTFGYIYQPIEVIGAYIPGGKFPLISTALMTLIPAKVAGCSRRIACSPSIHPALLAAASLSGATDFLHCGGAQAIGSMSYGFEKMKPVDMIVGPGNAYVNSAKKFVQSRTKIDALAGPSELLIYANRLKNPMWIVMDALAQAEHDPNAVSLVVSTSKQLIKDVYNLVSASNAGLQLIENQQILFIEAGNDTQAVTLINDYAPEHLMVCDDCDTSLFTNYGSLFIGENSAVAFGDYCAGPNHTLPTNGTSRSTGGLSVHQFLKVLSTQNVNDFGRKELAKTSSILAKVEGLTFHQQSCEVRN